MPQLRLFMQHHVFAVWDFMLLLKSLQQHLAPSGTPWLPPPHPALAGLINDLVAEEECDCLPQDLGGPLHLSHFEIYRLAMRQVKADTTVIDAVLRDARRHGMAIALQHAAIPVPSRRFMATTQALINTEQPHLLAAAFCYGRELLVPGLFRDLQNQLISAALDAPILLWYLQRHISLDGERHGPLAEAMVRQLCQNKAAELEAVTRVRADVEAERQRFWAAIAAACAAGQANA